MGWHINLRSDLRALSDADIGAYVERLLDACADIKSRRYSADVFLRGPIRHPAAYKILHRWLDRAAWVGTGNAALDIPLNMLAIREALRDGPVNRWIEKYDPVNPVLFLCELADALDEIERRRQQPQT